MDDLVHDATAVVADVAEIEAHAGVAALRLAGAATVEAASASAGATGIALQAISSEGSYGDSIGHDISHIATTLGRAGAGLASKGVADLGAAWDHFTEGGRHHAPAAPHPEEVLPIDP